MKLKVKLTASVVSRLTALAARHAHHFSTRQAISRSLTCFVCTSVWFSGLHRAQRSNI